MLARLRRLFRYDDWANRETLGAAATPRARALVAHVLGTEWLWLSRVRETPTPVPVWPDEWDAARCSAEADRLAPEWSALLDEGEGVLARRVSYRNSKGEPWSNTVEDVLLHVILHSAYHRGQAAAEARAAGAEPAYTDYIHAVRTGKV